MSGWAAVHAFAPLPAFYVVALALGLSLALRRWFDPLPGRVLLLFVLYLALLFAPVLVGDGVLLPVDLLRHRAPFQHLPPSDPRAVPLQRDLIYDIAPWELDVKRTLLEGRWPLWNALQGAGMPLMADPQSQAFQPLVAVAYPLPLWTAAGVTAALKVLLALVGSFLLLRRQGLSEAPAAAGATAYGLGGFVLLWLGWPVATCAAVLPALLYALVRSDDVGRRRDFLLLAVTTAVLALSGHPETMIYSAGLAALFLVDRCTRRRPRRAGLALFLHCGLAIGLGGALAAPVLLPAAAYLPSTTRSTSVRSLILPAPLALVWRDLRSPETLAHWRQEAIHRLVPLVAPEAFGNLRSSYWGAGNYIEDNGEFNGSLPFALALLGLTTLRPRSPCRFPQERLAASVLLGGLALLAQPPGIDRLIVRLPLAGLTAAHRNHRIHVLLTFCICYLAACELERWRRGERRWPALSLAGGTTAVLAAAAYFANPRPPGGRPEDFQIVTLACQLAALCLGMTAILVGITRAGSGGPAGGSRSDAAPGDAPVRGAGGWRALSPWLVTITIAAELLFLYLPANPANDRRLAYPRLPSLAFLQAHLGGDRLAGAGRALPPNTASIYGLADARIDNQAAPDLYARATRFLDSGTLEPRFGRFEHPLYAFLGVRWVLATPGVALPLQLSYRGADAWIWERPDPLPRLILPERAKIDSHGGFESWLEGNPDFGFRALVEPGGVVPGGQRSWRAAQPDASSLREELRAATRLCATARLGEPRLLAASILQDGCWRVLADGRLLGSVLVNGAFVGAWLPKGATRIDLVYRSTPHAWGCVLAALAAAAGAAWWIAPPGRLAAPAPP